MIKNVEDIRAVPILEVVKQYVDLKQQGRLWVACCPFHTEKTPSFTIDTSKNKYNCYGCNQSGDGVAFLMDYPETQFSFPEALEKVAALGGIEPDYEQRGKASKWLNEQKEQKAKEKSFLPLVKLVYDEYRKLADDLEIKIVEVEDGDDLEYIHFMGRDYLKSTLEKFGFGVAPTRLLCEIYNDNSWNLDFLIALGLVKEKDDHLYDFFRNRHLVSIKDHIGNIRGFAGRVLDDQIPKYLNSGESDLYKKKDLLFGLFENKSAIREEDTAILVEGYTDVMTMYEFGFPNVVANCGTALTMEQCRLLKRFCSMVFILGDNDGAGHKATIRNVDILIQSGLRVKVIDWPKSKEKEDPDNYLRKKGVDAFRKLISSVQDGLTWRVMLDVTEDEYSKRDAVETAARLISHIKGSIERNIQIGFLIHKSKLGPGIKRDLEQAIQDEENKRLKRTKGDELSPTQERDIRNYNIFIMNNGQGAKYYRRDSSQLIPLTNFIIVPIYHIASFNNPTRMVEIRNQYGASSIIDAHTDTFVEFGPFKKEVARYGNYRFEGRCKSADFIQIIAKVMDEMPTVYRITTLGYHKKGFWVWCNGITVDGVFWKSIDNGLVSHDEIKYILPGRNFENKNEDALDDNSTENQYIQQYKYKDNDYPFEKWCENVYEVFGENGLVGIGYYLSALFRDLLYEKFKSFPILNLFGQKGSGKSTLAWSLSFLFGDARLPLNLNNFTKAGFVARGQQIRNGLLWADEFSNQLDDWVHELLKGVYDGTGREKRTLDHNKSTQNQNVISALMLSGQDMPLKHIALLTRCITLNFNYKKSEQGYRRYKRLNELEKTGKLSHFTSIMQKHRPVIEKDFDQAYDQCKTELELKLNNHLQHMPRTIQNHNIILTTIKVLSQVIEFPKIGDQSFYEALLSVLSKLVTNQTQIISSQDELGLWWRTFQNFVEKKIAIHEMDFIVSMEDSITLKKPNTRKESFKKNFEHPKKILFLRFINIHPAYLEKLKKQGNTGYPIETIKYMLNTSDPFIGEVRAKRFHKLQSSVKCWAFDMDLLDFDILESIAVRQNSEDAPSPLCPDTNLARTKCLCKTCREVLEMPAVDDDTLF